MGIREMLDEVRTETLNKAEKTLEEAKSKANSMIIEKIDQLEKFYAEKREEFSKELLLQKKKMMGKTDMEIIKDIQEKKTNLYKSFFNELIMSVVEELRRDRKIYMNFFHKVYENLKKDLKGKKYEIFLSFNDEKIANDIKNIFSGVDKISFQNIIGGIIIKFEDTYIDVSLDSIFEKYREDILRVVVSEIGD